jgi:hypothetical protein
MCHRRWGYCPEVASLGQYPPRIGVKMGRWAKTTSAERDAASGSRAVTTSRIGVPGDLGRARPFVRSADTAKRPYDRLAPFVNFLSERFAGNRPSDRSALRAGMC